MARRSFAVEDGSLNTPAIVTSRARAYTDIDLLFKAKGNGDLYKKNDAAAVKQAVKNLIQTNFHEKPFTPYFGANLRNMLFELAGNDVDYIVQEDIKAAAALSEDSSGTQSMESK